MSWFEVKATYEKEVGSADGTFSGALKKTTDLYLVSAETFSEAEKIMATTLATEFPGRPIEIATVAKRKYAEFFNREDVGYYYKAKVGIISLDETTGKEKTKFIPILVGGESIDDALRELHKGMSGTMADYRIASIADTGIVGIVQ